MHADAHFVIGLAHVTGGKPCQDYATSGTLPSGGIYAIVADGCSSGRRTDVGARVVALATAQALGSVAARPTATTAEVEAMVSAQQRLAFDLSGATLGLATDDLLATCGYIYAGADRMLAHLHGDGVIAWRYADGRTRLARFDWADNTPSYPVYARDGFAGFVAAHGGDPEAIKLVGQYWRADEGADPLPYYKQKVPLGLGTRGITLSLPADVQLVAIFTDGVTQVDGLDWQQAVIQLLDFKTTTGEFAKRRLNRFVKDSHQTGRGPIDDLAYVAAWLEPEETP